MMNINLLNEPFVLCTLLIQIERWKSASRAKLPRPTLNNQYMHKRPTGLLYSLI